jgi:hypothetical protein
MAETLCLSKNPWGGVLACGPRLFSRLYHVPAGFVRSCLLSFTPQVAGEQKRAQTLKCTERIATKASDQNRLVSLPVELIEKVFQSLDWRSVLTVRRVSAFT